MFQENCYFFLMLLSKIPLAIQCSLKDLKFIIEDPKYLSYIIIVITL